MSAEPVRRRKNRKTNTSLGIPHTFSFPLLPTHECRAVNLHMMTLKILFHMDVKCRPRGRPVSAPEFSCLESPYTRRWHFQYLDSRLSFLYVSTHPPTLPT